MGTGVKLGWGLLTGGGYHGRLLFWGKKPTEGPKTVRNSQKRQKNGREAQPAVVPRYNG